MKKRAVLLAGLFFAFLLALGWDPSSVGAVWRNSSLDSHYGYVKASDPDGIYQVRVYAPQVGAVFNAGALEATIPGFCKQEVYFRLADYLQHTDATDDHQFHYYEIVDCGTTPAHDWWLVHQEGRVVGPYASAYEAWLEATGRTKDGLRDPGPRPVVGTIQWLEGPVTITNPKGELTEPYMRAGRVRGGALYEEDRVRVGAGGRARIVFLNGSVIELSPDEAMPGGEAGDVQLFDGWIHGGRWARFNGGKAAGEIFTGERDVHLELWNRDCAHGDGVRGTVLGLSVDPAANRAWAGVYRGSIELWRYSDGAGTGASSGSTGNSAVSGSAGTSAAASTSDTTARQTLGQTSQSVLLSAPAAADLDCATDAITPRPLTDAEERFFESALFAALDGRVYYHRETGAIRGEGTFLSLHSMVLNARDAFDRGQRAVAARILRAFRSLVAAQADKQIESAAAADLDQRAGGIVDDICGGSSGTCGASDGGQVCPGRSCQNPGGPPDDCTIDDPCPGPIDPGPIHPGPIKPPEECLLQPCVGDVTPRQGGSGGSENQGSGETTVGTVAR